MHNLEVLEEFLNVRVTDNTNNTYYTKREKTIRFIAKNMKGFLQFCSCSLSKNVLAEDILDEVQSEYNAVIMSMINNNLSTEQLAHFQGRCSSVIVRSRKYGVCVNIWRTQTVKHGSGNAQWFQVISKE